MNKALLLGVLVFLVVGVVIGLIAGVNHHHSTTDEDGQVLSTTNKSVASVCSWTDYKRACVSSMSSLANNASATPNDFLQATINVATEEVQGTRNRSLKIGQAANNPVQKMAVEDCKELLEYAVEELQASYSMVGDSNLHTAIDRSPATKLVKRRHLIPVNLHRELHNPRA